MKINADDYRKLNPGERILMGPDPAMSLHRFFRLWLTVYRAPGSVLFIDYE